MNDDITQRLWSWAVHTGDPLFAEAADEIARLRDLIETWADIEDSRFANAGIDPTLIKWSLHQEALRKAVGR